MKIAENTTFCQALEPQYIAVDFFWEMDAGSFSYFLTG
jgi:hypothetical protein